MAVAGGRVLALTLFAPTIFGTGAVFDAGLMSVAGGPVPFFGPIVPAMELFFFFWIVDALARDTSAPVTHWTRPREPGPRTMLHCVHAGVLVVGGLTALLRPGAITSLGGLPAFAQVGQGDRGASAIAFFLFHTRSPPSTSFPIPAERVRRGAAGRLCRRLWDGGLGLGGARCCLDGHLSRRCAHMRDSHEYVSF